MDKNKQNKFHKKMTFYYLTGWRVSISYNKFYDSAEIDIFSKSVKCGIQYVMLMHNMVKFRFDWAEACNIFHRMTWYLIDDWPLVELNNSLKNKPSLIPENIYSSSFQVQPTVENKHKIVSYFQF